MDSPAQAALPFDINPSFREGGKRAMLPSASAYGPELAGQVRSVQEYVQAVHMSLGDVAGPPETSNSVAAKALGVSVPQAYAFANFSFMPDAGNWGLMQWPGINPESLRKVCRENVLPRLIIQARVADMARYSGLSSKPWEPGWQIVLRDAKATPTAKDRSDIKEAENFIYNGSRDFNAQDARERDAKLLSPFQMLLRAFADDIHTFDGWALWTQPDRLGRPIAFANLPAGLIRLAAPGQGLKGDRSKFAALIDQTGNPVKMFTRRELTWSITTPRTDPAAFGYGWPIVEQGMRLIQGLQSGIDLNCDVFQRNGIPNGMLLLKGDFFSQEQIDALMREWTNMKRGVSKLWGMPIMAVPEDGSIEVLNFMDMKGEDVRYKDHMNMMTGFYCGLSQFPVRRLGMFASGGHRDNQPLPDEAVEIQGVDDPGLPATLQFVEDRINPYLLWPTWSHLKMQFLNKNPKEDARSYEAKKQARTWKESRAEADLPSLSSLASKELKPLMEIMELCPEDSSKIAAFQTVATTMLKAQLGLEGGKDEASPGAPFPSKTDPAKSSAHGHAAGVRRSGEGAAA